MFPPKDFDKDKIFDDIARVAGGAATLAGGASKQIRDEIRSRFDDMAARMDLVPREDFEKLEAMLTEARLKQEDMLKRIAALEGKKPATKKTAAKKAPAKKPTAKKAAQKKKTTTAKKKKA